MGLERKNYMVTVQARSTEPHILVPMEWARNVNHMGFLNLLFMPHFGKSMQVTTYVKQLLVYFHIGCLWLN